MSIRKGTPGRGSGSRPDSFSYTGVGNGLKASFGAWLAGPPYWCEEAHEYHEKIGPTKPCLHWISNGELRCDRCRKQPEVRCLAWVPLYREQDTKPIIVIVHEVASDLLAPLRYPDYCLVGRLDSVSSVFVRASDTALSLKTEKECRKKPVDITNDLLGIWNMPDLNEWLRSGGGRREMAPAAPAVVVPESIKARHTPMYQAAAARAEALATPEVEEAMARALKRVKEREAKPSTNGKHKHEGGSNNA